MCHERILKVGSCNGERIVAKLKQEVIENRQRILELMTLLYSRNVAVERLTGNIELHNCMIFVCDFYSNLQK